tara:strand:- start:2225 stop:2854 length:630 start_codon:yes stop_codon:yes gene_type:complete
MIKDHPIFLESIKFIRSKLLENSFNSLETKVLERLIHTSGDFQVQNILKFSENVCENAIKALNFGAPILTDTDMAAIAIKSVAQYYPANKVYSAKQWIDEDRVFKSTKTSYGMAKAWIEISSQYYGSRSPIVVFGSSPTALEKLLDIIEKSNNKPSLIVGMPVGFIGVEQSKSRLLSSKLPYIVLCSSKGGAAMAGATVNALLRESLVN